MSRRKKKGKRKSRSHRKRLPRKQSTYSPKAELPTGFSTPVIHTFSWQNPASNIPLEKRLALIRKIGQEATDRLAKAQAEFQGLAIKHEPTQLLATAALYCLHKNLDDDTDFTSDGPYPQSVVEALQSLLLALKPVSDFGEEPTLHRDLFGFLDFARQCIDDLGNRGFAAIADAPPDEHALRLAMENARAYTRGVRNWGYPQHMWQITAELFEPLDADIVRLFGFKVADLLGFFHAISEAVLSRTMLLFESKRDVFKQTSLEGMVAAMVEHFCMTSEQGDDLSKLFRSKNLKLDELRMMLIAFLHQYFPDCFLFTKQELADLFPAEIETASLHALMTRISLPFGALADTPFEHLLTQSPIRLQPFIAIADGTYFIPILGLLNTFALDIVESLIKTDTQLWARYSPCRANYLEKQVHGIFRGSFPDALVESNLSWREPVSKQDYETDTLVVLGPLALVIESKSKRVSDSARRGGPERLRRDFGEIVDSASEQAQRLAELLERETSDVVFISKDDRRITVPAGKIQRAVCLTVTLDDLPASSLCWNALVKAGLVDASRRPTISLTLSDLIVVMEALSHPAIRLHYLWRRSECESGVEYFGDEEDLLVYYLSNGLATLTSTPKGKAHSFYLSGNSDELRRYYMSLWNDPDSKVPPPRRLLTPWWLSVLERVQSLDHPDKWEVACCLLDLSYQDQKDLEQRFRGLPKRFRRAKRKRKDAMLICPPSTESQCAIVIFGYSDLPADERRARAQNLMEQTHADCGVKRVVLFAKRIDTIDPPYDFLYFSRLPEGDAVPSSAEPCSGDEPVAEAP